MRQGTVGIEILEQVPDVDAIVVPVGGAGLIAGIALAVKTLRPEVAIYGVEPERAASYRAALANNGPVMLQDMGSTLADGLAVPCVGANAFSVSKDYVDHCVEVQEKSIALSVLRLVENEKIVVEGSGATGLAGIIEAFAPWGEEKPKYVRSRDITLYYCIWCSLGTFARKEASLFSSGLHLVSSAVFFF